MNGRRWFYWSGTPLLAFFLAGAAPQEERLTGDVRLVLEKAVLQRRPGGAVPRDLELDLRLEEGRWAEEAWGYAADFNKSDHEGRVKARAGEGKIRLDVEMTFQPDPWVAGGGGSYEILLEAGEGKFHGTFHGTFNGSTVEGKVSGGVAPPSWRPVADHEPLELGEHPRLAFRKGEIDALREKAKTREGKAIVSRLRQLLDRAPLANENAGPYAAGHGFLYALTGEKKHAAQARDLVEKQVRDRLPGPPAWRSGGKLILRVPPVVGVALAYDLCYDAWEESFREGVARELEGKVLEFLRGGGPGYVMSPESHWNGVLRGGAGLAALAILGDPCAFPQPEPPDPASARKVRPPGDFEPPASVPVNRTPDPLFQRWLLAGPFVRSVGGEDFLAPLGGPSRARPQEGTKVAAGGRTLAFRAMDPKLVQNAKGRTGLEIVAAANRVVPSTLYYYSVLDNDRDRLVRFPPDGGARLWIAGERVEPDGYAKLGKGKYPLLLQVELDGLVNGGAWVFPRLVELDPEQAGDDHEKAHDAWEKARAEWEESGKHSAAAARSLKICERSVRRYLASALGDRGWCVEGEEAARVAFCQGVFPFLAALRTAEGRDLAAGSGAEAVLPFVVSRTLPRSGALGGPEPWERSAARSGDFALGLGLLPERLRPAVLWSFNRAFGLEGDRTFDVTLPHHAIYALAAYPVGAKPRNPADLLPRSWGDAKGGYFLFRREWKGDEDVVATIAGRSAAGPQLVTAADAGSFRLWGFGNAWARVAGSRGGRTDRSDENVLQVPGVFGFGPARASYSDFREDGSGVVTLNMDEVYRDEKDQDVGIRGLRSFAVDYGGRSGAPALFAVADRLKGGPSKLWTMHPDGEVKIEGRSFTVRGPRGATLRGTFLAPAELQLATKGGSILAMGGDEYFVVMTLQKGAAPPVEAEGAGLESRARVGDQVVRFDGEKVVLGE